MALADGECTWFRLLMKSISLVASYYALHDLLKWNAGVVTVGQRAQQVERGLKLSCSRERAEFPTVTNPGGCFSKCQDTMERQENSYALTMLGAEGELHIVVTSPG